ncbi:MAG: aminotransferase [Alphaproteobacteria bacterium]|nr:aminotransferase [Alphaproteobacteria bacterium]
MPMFNPNVKVLGAPPVAVVLDWIDQYDGGHGPLIDLSQAVPGYPPHPDMMASLARAAADTASLGYGAIEGDDELRSAYARHVAGHYGGDIRADDVMITSGCNQAFITAIMAIAGAGDKVLMVEPSYFNHDLTLKMLGISSGYIKASAETGFIPSLEDIRAAITPDVKALALVNPNNPTGAIYPPDLLHEVMAICVKAGIWLLLDETYRDFLPPQDRAHDLFHSPSWRGNLMVLYSFSKAYCIPGHRLGAVVASPEAIAEMAKIMDSIQICAPRLGQMALTPMIDALAEWRAENSRQMAARAAAFQATMAKAEGWEIKSLGAYFGYVEHPLAMSSGEAAEVMVRKAGVLTIPGDFFGEGQGRYLRFAFANADIAVIEQIADRLNLLS